MSLVSRGARHNWPFGPSSHPAYFKIKCARHARKVAGGWASREHLISEAATRQHSPGLIRTLRHLVVEPRHPGPRLRLQVPTTRLQRTTRCGAAMCTELPRCRGPAAPSFHGVAVQPHQASMVPVSQPHGSLVHTRPQHRASTVPTADKAEEHQHQIGSRAGGRELGASDAAQLSI